MTSVIYYDLASAESFALNEIVLGLDVPALEWRGVQMDPSLPEPMARFDRRGAARLEMEVVAVRKAAPEVSLQTPTGRPNTRRALQAVAAVARMHPPRASDFRTALFRAYWWRSADLSDMATIREVAESVGVPPWVELDHQAAQAAQVGWEIQWQSERLGGVPRVIRADGQILWQLADAGSVATFLTGA